MARKPLTIEVQRCVLLWIEMQRARIKANAIEATINRLVTRMTSDEIEAWNRERERNTIKEGE